MSSPDAALCANAFDVIIARLKDQSEPAPLQRDQVGGVFVTWSIRVPDNEYELWDLRGCIGMLTPTNLGVAVKDYAKIAAFQDHRFEPITSSEVKNLQVGISVLHDFQRAAGPYEWDVGRHGLILNFDVGGTDYSATYLPEIAVEQGWTQQECIESLAEKAGFSGTLTSRILDSMSVTKYQSAKRTMTHPEYLEYKENNG